MISVTRRFFDVPVYNYILNIYYKIPSSFATANNKQIEASTTTTKWNIQYCLKFNHIIHYYCHYSNDYDKMMITISQFQSLFHFSCPIDLIALTPIGFKRSIESMWWDTMWTYSTTRVKQSSIIIIRFGTSNHLQSTFDIERFHRLDTVQQFTFQTNMDKPNIRDDH